MSISKDYFVILNFLDIITANQDDVNNAPMRPPRNIAKFNTTTALDRSTGSGHRSSSKDHDSASNNGNIKRISFGVMQRCSHLPGLQMSPI